MPYQGSTITVQQTLNWLTAFIVQRPTTGVAGVANEPGLTTSNKVLQTILAPPFKWPWNRTETSFSANQVGISDYAVSLTNFGFIEKAAYTIAGNATQPVKELTILTVQTPEQKPNPPGYISAQQEDGAGNITFRLLPPPDQTYSIIVTYQKAAPLITALGNSWSPIPDRFSFLYEQGMMAHLQGMYSPQLYAVNMQFFFQQLVGAAQGLTDTEKAIFLEEKMRQVRTEQEVMMNQGRRQR